MDINKATNKSTYNSAHSAKYVPSRLEKRLMEVSRSVLHYDEDMADECDLYRNKDKKELHSEYNEYLVMLDRFTNATRAFSMDVDDLRLIPAGKRKKMCKRMDKVLHGSFRAKRDCSWTNAGFVEPLLPPMRHPHMCQNKRKRKAFITSIDYLVHDFGAICRRLDVDTRTVFFDLGASLEFHGGKKNPALSLVKLYNKFGIEFDHYYAFEYTFMKPPRVYKKVPEELLHAYHWYNVPVESSPVSKQNPWKSILSKFTPNDLVVVKLDIDTASVEIPLVRQLLQDEYAPLVDHVYFEHHVRMKDLWDGNWRKSPLSVNGTLQDSLDLFTSLREAGIGAHSWV